MAQVVAPPPTLEIETRRPPSRRGSAVVPAAGLALVALALRVATIDHEPLWLDEGYTLLFSGLPLPQLFTVGGAHEHPPLFYLIVHLLRAIDNWYLIPRLISAVAGSLVVAATFFLGYRLYGYAAGFVAGALAAVAPMHVWYSQDGRGYEVACLAVIFSYLALFEALRGRPRWWIAYALATSLCLYAEYTTVFALVPQVAAIAVAYRHRSLRRLLLSWAGAALLFAPWAGMLSGNASAVVSSYWISMPTFGSVTTTALQFLGLVTPCPEDPCKGILAPVPGLAASAQSLTVAMICATLLVTIVSLLRRRPTEFLLAAWVWVPFAVVILIAFRRPLYLDRVFLDATFPLYILAGAGITWLARRTKLAYLLVIPVLLVSALSISNIVTAQSNPDWRSASLDFAKAYRPGQSVIFYPGVIGSIVHAYLPGWRGTYERPIWYNTYLDVPDWQKRYAGVSDPRLRVMQIRAAARHGAGVWLIAQDYTGLNRARHWFVAHDYRLVLSEMYHNDTRIELWSRKAFRELGTAVVHPGFGPGWKLSGRARVHGIVLTLNGNASATRRFRVQPGATYFFDVSYRAAAPSTPSIQVLVRDDSGKPVATYINRYGRLIDGFPRTQWYNLPVTGVWLNQPFGFVAPAGSRTATIVISNRWGQVSWRGVAAYRQR